MGPWETFTRARRACSGRLCPLLGALLLGCASGRHVSEPVAASELTRIAREYQHGLVRLRSGEVITRDRLAHAELELDVRPCETTREALERRHCTDLTLPLDQLSTDSEHLTPDTSEPWQMRGLRVVDVERASLELEVKPEAVRESPDMVSEPQGGVGVMVLGPALVVAIAGQVFVTDYLVGEAGLFGSGGLIDGYVGFRVRPGARDSLRTWFGAAIGFACGEGDGEATADPDSSQEEDAVPLGCGSAATLRLGVDWVFGGDAYQLTPEFDLLIPTDSNLEREVAPWGGITLSALF